ncbi:spectrin beta chain [Schistosoma japonicum]|nr:spectrin beta chain [Schistosoma japonicum]
MILLENFTRCFVHRLPRNTLYGINEFASTSLPAPCYSLLSSFVSHDLNSNKERGRLSTVDQQTIVIDVLTEQKSLTVDKQIVINSTSRQMDHQHYVEQLVYCDEVTRGELKTNHQKSVFSIYDKSLMWLLSQMPRRLAHDNHSITLTTNRFVANIYELPPPTIKHNTLLPINQDQPVTDSNNKLKLITLESLQPVLEYHR